VENQSAAHFPGAVQRLAIIVFMPSVKSAEKVRREFRGEEDYSMLAGMASHRYNDNADRDLMGNFVSQLKQRRVYRVAIGYAVAAWLMVQIAATVLPAFHAPEFILPVLIILLGVGFPVALVLAWAFDVTPSGIEKTPEGTGASAAKNLRYAWALGGIGLLVAVIGVGAYWWWHSPGAKRTNESDAAPQKEAARTALPAIPEKSIAVLPFENLSSDKENAYFADGVQDEILSDLAKIADLKVISRTSVLQYKTGVARNLREIGQQLGVAHLLEGSVQRAGNKVRVNAQLIDARTDGHLWAQVFDRPLDDVFAIQSEIAQAIADQLQAKLSPKEAAEIKQKPTTDMAAYDLYLRAKEIQRSSSNGFESVQREIALLDQAVTKDPSFVDALCLLAETHVSFYWFNYDHTAARLELAKKALDAAAKLSPDSGKVHYQRAVLYYRGQRDYAAALKELALVRRSSPNDSDIPFLTGMIERRQGHFTETITWLEQALAIDPHNAPIISELCNAYTWTGHYAEARRLMDEALTGEPNNFILASRRARIDYWQNGDLRRMQQLASKEINSATDPGDLVKFRLALAWCQRDFPAAQRALAEYRLPDVATSGFIVPREEWEGVLWKRLGESAKAQSALEQARERAATAIAARPDDAKALSVLADIDAELGRKEEAIREGERSVNLMPVEKDAVDGYLLQNALALTYAKAGANSSALDLLEKLTGKPFGPEYGTLLAPDWDPIRAEPRFQKILAGLAPNPSK
jgi:TolB-like protein/Flp pilus assembly protein TadD